MFGKMIIFLGGRWELETLLCSRGAPSCAQAGGGSKAGQEQSCAWEGMCEFLCLAGQRSCGERAGSLEERGSCKAQQSEEWLWGVSLGQASEGGGPGRAGLVWREGSDQPGWENLELNPGQKWPAGGRNPFIPLPQPRAQCWAWLRAE